MTLQELKDKVRLPRCVEGRLPACWLGHSLGMAAGGMYHRCRLRRRALCVPALRRPLISMPRRCPPPRLAGLPPGEGRKGAGCLDLLVSRLAGGRAPGCVVCIGPLCGPETCLPSIAFVIFGHHRFFPPFLLCPAGTSTPTPTACTATRAPTRSAPWAGATSRCTSCRGRCCPSCRCVLRCTGG